MDNLLRIIHELGKNIDDETSIRQLALHVNTPYTTTYRTIEEHKQLFTIKKKGQARLVSLNKNDDIVKHYLIISEREASNTVYETQTFLKSIRHDIKEGTYALILFGSRAEQKHREESDIDLCVINKKGEKNISFNSFELLSGKEVNTLYFSEKEFIGMIRDKEHNVAKEILKKHVVLKGEEYYWNLVWKNVT